MRTTIVTAVYASYGPHWGETSEQETKELLHRDAGIAERAELRLIFVPLTDGHFGALASFVFNVGAGRLQRSTLRRKVNRKEHSAVPAELMKWVWAGGRKLKGLVRRRKPEATLYAASLAGLSIMITAKNLSSTLLAMAGRRRAHKLQERQI